MHAAEATGQNEVQFGRDTRVIQSNIVLNRGLVSPRETECQNPSLQWCQVTLSTVVYV